MGGVPCGLFSLLCTQYKTLQGLCLLGNVTNMYTVICAILLRTK
nr:MAG TPA: hypothetical protein [Caudoviricetes sp.]